MTDPTLRPLEEIERDHTCFTSLATCLLDCPEHEDGVWEAARDRLLAEVERLRADNEKLRGFAVAALDENLIETSELALEHGLVKEVEALGPCSDVVCLCAETADFPTTCYRRTALLTGGTPDAN